MRGPGDVLYTAYERQLVKGLPPERLPRHVGLMLDGNRRWAKKRGANTAHGHKAGADNIEPLLTWCEELGIEVVTLWLLSTDNLKRSETELAPLLAIIEDVVDELSAAGNRRFNLVGALGLLPEATRTRLENAVSATQDGDGMVVNIAVGYGGRQEIVDAFRAILLDAAERGEDMTQLAQRLTIDSVGDYLYTKGQPDPDLVIRTSGEQRLGGFLLWQSAHSEFYFCEAFWPDFRRVDFLRALRAYAERERRFGS
ncbi:isoprenyl transferase [Dermacoccus nishinomiyaensis]|uniref:Isoprenyl transferase n=1 Tax=Dermacoccus nishinomiyaensis TaxID=1274 RepID=A0A075JGQ7_9MICO|nr:MULTISPECIES: isoprenyl transferase [Dermacoccus]AIF41391.1 UDP pyrophosphate synthase [Dermacoccus nishinomiyaensis]EFP58946.1 putative di-trans,poly-cis-decaprenylcistransferase [Dermacoccus sp. Ellin185]MBO1759081.1 isoprenyl transferase [Dermacoccus sp. NHGro5]MCG7430749.1 isoprenyl transferase [Dermacoccus nishinomiyaensis]MCI0153343.1 isoprenyl transferase [Dermacoccus nishinomiyaensis]